MHAYTQNVTSVHMLCHEIWTPLTLWNQSEMPGVMCRRLEFKQQLHKKDINNTWHSVCWPSHRVTGIPNVCPVYMLLHTTMHKWKLCCAMKYNTACRSVATWNFWNTELQHTCFRTSTFVLPSDEILNSSLSKENMEGSQLFWISWNKLSRSDKLYFHYSNLSLLTTV